MGERSEILARVRHGGSSGQALRAAMEGSPAPTAGALRPVLHNYILDRLALPPEEGDSDELLELSERSLRRYIRLVREGAVKKGPGNQCSTASSVVVKKVLLMKAIQTELSVRFTPAQAAALTTVTALAEEIVRQKRGAPCSES